MTARSALHRIVRFEEGEGPALCWAFAYFFCLLSSYYVIRPLRDAMGLEGRESALTWLYMGTLVGTLLANPVMGALVTRYPRRVFVPAVYHFLVLQLVGFWALLTLSPESYRLAVARVFFVWVSVFNLFAVSVFWGFMADTFRSEQGKRLFGFIGMGGTLGAIAGAALTKQLAPVLGPMPLLLVAAGLLEGAVLCVHRLSRLAQGPVAETPPGRGFANGIRLVSTSPYLAGICAFMLLYSISSTILYFEQARIVRASFPDAATRAAFFARIDLYVNVVTVFVQAFFTGRILSWIGVGGALSALPAITLGGFGALALAPAAATLVAVQVIRRSAEFALVRPAREVLFTVVSREEKYTAKSLIDTFVYRTGDAAGALLDRALSAASLGFGVIGATFLPVAVLWVILSMALGRRQAVTASHSPSSP